MINITWLGHGTFQLELETGEIVVLDPWIDGNPSYPATHCFHRVNAIPISHGHFDHIQDAVPLTRKFSPEVVAIYETGHWLESRGVKNCTAMNKGGAQKVARSASPLSVTMTHAVHSCGILEDGKIIYGGGAAGYTSVFSDMALIHELYRPQLAFLPIVDLFTMGPREAAAACRQIKAEKILPMHFGAFPPLTGTPAALESLLEGASSTVRPLTQGHSVAW